ncbi:MAG: hypothetical protein OXL41_10375 [Nitrospinae bacterium]|nr:hypothetical protein [Nitrospinota bacterium]
MQEKFLGMTPQELDKFAEYVQELVKTNYQKLELERWKATIAEHNADDENDYQEELVKWEIEDGVLSGIIRKRKTKNVNLPDQKNWQYQEYVSRIKNAKLLDVIKTSIVQACYSEDELRGMGLSLTTSAPVQNSTPAEHNHTPAEGECKGPHTWRIDPNNPQALSCARCSRGGKPPWPIKDIKPYKWAQMIKAARNNLALYEGMGETPETYLNNLDKRARATRKT